MVELGETPVQGVGEVIRLAVAPVFLLSGVGIMLTVFTNRLARAVDRARELERSAATMPEAQQTELHQPLAALAQRGRLLSVAIALCTVCALLSFIGAILCFLREVFIATATLRIGLRKAR